MGGDFIEITYNHPDFGSGSFYPIAGEESDYDLGGIRSADEESSIDGAGRIVDKMNRIRWSFNIAVSNDPTSTRDLDRAKQLAGSTKLATWTFTHINGTVYEGLGKPVGDLKGAGQTGRFALKVSGGGEMTPIS